MNQREQIEEMANIITSADPYVNCKGQSCLTCEFQDISKNCYTAKTLYNAGYRKQEWISVEDRLPEVGTRVVGYDYESNVRCYFITEGRWWIDEGWNTAKGWGITHWMPLPEAPKMKGGE